MNQFRILHCLRAPVGGLFRHVRDLATAQAELGHLVAIACDSRTGGTEARKTLERLEDVCALGVYRVPMSRQIGILDYLAYHKIERIAARQIGASVVHGHGAKGGAYARLIAAKAKERGHFVPAIYTPHGGSLHYDPLSLLGRLYLGLEQRLAPMTDGLIFESSFSAHAYARKVCPPPCPSRVIPNGLNPEEFYDVVIDADAADFLFVGELRDLKGVDVLLQAAARLKRRRRFKVLIVGAGPDERRYRQLANRFGLEGTVRFLPPMPAGRAFAWARCLVLPSRAESLPYIVLEAAAANLPIIATRVGGIPDIVGSVPMPLVPADDVIALRDQMREFLDAPRVFAERAEQLQYDVSKRFTVAGMTHAVLDFYRELFHRERVGTNSRAAAMAASG